jgi:hypothetical protein
MERVRDNPKGKHGSLCLEDRYVHNVRESMSLVFCMLEKYSHIDKIQLEDTLKMIYNTYSKYESLFDDTKDAFKEYFQRLTISRPWEILVALIESENTPDKCKDTMLKILLLLGVFAKSPEIILKVYNLVTKANSSIDLHEELYKNEEFKDMLTSGDNLTCEHEEADESFEDFRTDLEFKDPLQNYQIVIENCMLYQFDIRKAESVAFDNHYIYLFGKDFGLVKIGAESKDRIEKWKLYDHQTKWKGYHFNILCIGSLLFMRLHVLGEQKPLPDGLDEFRHHPFLIFRTEDLSNPINSEYRELYEKTKKVLKHNFIKKCFNKPCLERIEYSKIDKSENSDSDSRSSFVEEGYRVILDTQFATDGKYLYVPAYYVEHFIRPKWTTKIIIEKYCPKTWMLLDQITFFDEENQSEEEWDSNGSWLIKLEEILKSPSRFKQFATNGVKFCLISDTSMCTFTTKKSRLLFFNLLSFQL